jgi:hypothetical protein
LSGTQIGADFAGLNVDGWNLRAGSTIGYLGAKTQEATPPGLNPPPSFATAFESLLSTSAEDFSSTDKFAGTRGKSDRPDLHCCPDPRRVLTVILGR